MDWLSLIAGLVLGIIGNLLTPAVQSLLRSMGRWTGSELTRASENGVRTRLAQLEAEHAGISHLRSNPSELTRQVMATLMALILVTWALLTMAFVASYYADDKFIVHAMYGGMGGMASLGLRWLLTGIFIWSTADKVADFEKFQNKNLEARRKVESLLNRMTTRSL